MLSFKKITKDFKHELLLMQFEGRVTYYFGTFSNGSTVRNPSQCRSHRECRFNPWVEKILWRGNGNPLQYSCQYNPMDRKAWWATVHGVTKSQKQLSDWAHMYNFASSKEQSQQFRALMKSITYKENCNYGKQKIDIMLHMKNSSKQKTIFQ